MFARSRQLLFVTILILSLALSACSMRQDLRHEPSPFDPASVSPAVDEPPQSAAFLFGAARLDISPTESIPLGGYGVYVGSMKNTRLSQGTHDPLYATAFFLLKGSQALVLIKTDLVGLFGGDIDAIRDAVATKPRLDRNGVIVASTHTHHSPDTVGLWGTAIPANSGRSEAYMHTVQQAAVEAAWQAYRQRQPACMFYALGEENDLHYNIHEGQWPDRNLDGRITLLKFVGRNGKTLGTLTNWACHPTTEDMPNKLASADWVGRFYQRLEQAGGLPMFVNGSIGGSVQPSIHWRDKHIGPEGSGQNFEWATKFGDVLADKAMALLDDQMTEVIFDDIEIQSRTVIVHPQNFIYRFAKVMGLLSMDYPLEGQGYPVQITAVKMGPLRLATLPGEMSPHLGLQIREALGGDAQVLIGLGNEWLGYILDREQYADDGFAYEKMLCISPEFGEDIVAAYRTIRF